MSTVPEAPCPRPLFHAGLSRAASVLAVAKTRKGQNRKALATKNTPPSSLPGHFLRSSHSDSPAPARGHSLYGSMMSALASPFTDKLWPWPNIGRINGGRSRQDSSVPRNGAIWTWFKDNEREKRFGGFMHHKPTAELLVLMRWREMNALSSRAPYQFAAYGFEPQELKISLATIFRGM